MHIAPDEETISITMKEYKEIQERLDKLDALEGGGVDNWEGYDFSMEAIYNEENE